MRRLNLLSDGKAGRSRRSTAIAADERGSLAPVLAMVMLVATAGAALAVDMARAYALKSDLQAAADAAALAAAVNLPDVERAISAALVYAQRNMSQGEFGQVLTADDIVFGHWNPASASVIADDAAPSAVLVTTRLADANNNAAPTIFASILGRDTMEVSARASAGLRSSACIVALDPSDRKAMDLTSHATMETGNCTVHVNSNSPEALTVGTSSSIITGSVCVTGDATIHSTAYVSPEPTIHCPPTADPLAGLDAPTYGACDYSNASHTNTTLTLHPGVYCGGLKIAGSSKITLASGLYIIKDGKLDLRGTSAVTGEDVVFYLTGSKAVLFFGSKTSLALSAPTDGPLAGILVFQDRAFSGNHSWDSGTPADLTGTIYLPGGNLMSKSSNLIKPVNSCSVLIARNIKLTGGSGLSVDLSGSECQSSLPSEVLGSPVLLE